MPLYSHFFLTRIYNNVRFGNLRFGWDGKAGEFWRLCLKGVLLSFLTLGVYYFFWYPRYFAYVRGHLSLEGHRFHGDVKPGEFFWLAFTNLLLIMVTVGIGTPWVIVRTMRFYLERLSLENPELLESALQVKGQKTAAGAEALADAMDLGIGIGF